MTMRTLLIVALASFALAAVEKYPSGKKKAEGELKNGKREGPWLGWYESGKPQYERGYQNGRPHGRWIEWYENGTRKSEAHYLGGKGHGPSRRWHPNGRLEREWVFKKGKPVDGTEQVFHAKLARGEPLAASALPVPEQVVRKLAAKCEPPTWMECHRLLASEGVDQ